MIESKYGNDVLQGRERFDDALVRATGCSPLVAQMARERVIHKWADRHDFSVVCWEAAIAALIDVADMTR